MVWDLMADGVVIVHGLFILFVAFGGLLALRRRRWIYLHIPAVIWGILVETIDLTCPLTPLENTLRRLAATTGYQGGFIDHYLIPVIYPEGLTRTHQVILAAAVAVINGAVYAYIWTRRGRPHREERGRKT